MRPTVQVLFQVNPEATVTVAYPPSSPNCLTNPVQTSAAQLRATTGSGAGPMLTLATLLTVAGAAALGGLAWRGRRQSGVE